MMRGTRIGKVAGLLAVVACLALPVSSANAGGGPVATKSGTLVHYASGYSLKVSKRIEILLVCTANCNVNATSTIKGPGFNQTVNVSGALNANVPGGPFFQPNSALLKSMKAKPGKFRIISNVTATDATTGAVDSISVVFKLKR
jgi:hypothetical protein